MTDSKPSLTTEQARRLTRIGEALRKRIRQSIKRMHTIPQQHVSAVIR